MYIFLPRQSLWQYNANEVNIYSQDCHELAPKHFSVWTTCFIFIPSSILVELLAKDIVVLLPRTVTDNPGLTRNDGLLFEFTNKQNDVL